nr:twist-related protein 1-like [Caretta caretta]
MAAARRERSGLGPGTYLPCLFQDVVGGNVARSVTRSGGAAAGRGAGGAAGAAQAAAAAGLAGPLEGGDLKGPCPQRWCCCGGRSRAGGGGGCGAAEEPCGPGPLGAREAGTARDRSNCFRLSADSGIA